MKPVSLQEVEQQLGQWEKEISYTAHSIEMRMERSANNLELLLPNPDRDVILLARPAGLQLTSQNGINVRKDFAIPAEKIVKAELLPSYTMDNRPRISFLYVLIAVAFFFVIDISSNEQPDILRFLVPGLLFGLLASVLFKRSYRMNLMLTLNGEDGREEIVFTIHKNQREQCIRFFTDFTGDKFSEI